jgi:hypothetical protein
MEWRPEAQGVSDEVERFHAGEGEHPSDHCARSRPASVRDDHRDRNRRQPVDGDRNPYGARKPRRSAEGDEATGCTPAHQCEDARQEQQIPQGPSRDCLFVDQESRRDHSHERRKDHDEARRSGARNERVWIARRRTMKRMREHKGRDGVKDQKTEIVRETGRAEQAGQQMKRDAKDRQPESPRLVNAAAPPQVVSPRAGRMGEES